MIYCILAILRLHAAEIVSVDFHGHYGSIDTIETTGGATTIIWVDDR